jgi:hypothetical protein
MALGRIFPLGLVSTALLFLPSLASSVPQQQKPSAQTTDKHETLTLTGTVSEKGALLSCADQKLYHILNAETLKHLEGQLVTLKARFLAEKGQLYVTAVRAEATGLPVAFHLEDAAFRR